MKKETELKICIAALVICIVSLTVAMCMINIRPSSHRESESSESGSGFVLAADASENASDTFVFVPPVSYSTSVMKYDDSEVSETGDKDINATLANLHKGDFSLAVQEDEYIYIFSRASKAYALEYRTATDYITILKTEDGCYIRNEKNQTYAEAPDSYITALNSVISSFSQYDTSSKSEEYTIRVQTLGLTDYVVYSYKTFEVYTIGGQIVGLQPIDTAVETDEISASFKTNIIYWKNSSTDKSFTIDKYAYQPSDFAENFSDYLPE